MSEDWNYVPGAYHFDGRACGLVVNWPRGLSREGSEKERRIVRKPRATVNVDLVLMLTTSSAYGDESQRLLPTQIDKCPAQYGQKNALAGFIEAK